MNENKICLTQKGFELIKDEAKEFKVKKEHFPAHKSLSLPSLQSTITNQSQQSFGKKQNNNNKLSKLSGTLSKIQSIGVKKLTIKNEEKELKKVLNEEMKDK